MFYWQNSNNEHPRVRTFLFVSTEDITSNFVFSRLFKSTHKEIKAYIQEGKIERVGATIDAERRHKEYERDGYKGMMLYAYTKNMKKTENTLLGTCETCVKNIQRTSNVEEKPGYVYAITKRPADNSWWSYCIIL